MAEKVRLKCIKDGSRLRVRIISGSYMRNANCRFPKNIRADGREYEVYNYDIKLLSGPRGKHFYSIPASAVTCLDDTNLQVELPTEQIQPEHVFNSGETECAICMTEDKSMVFVPCGHYYCCNDCSKRVSTCPICRSQITTIIHHSMVE